MKQRAEVAIERESRHAQVGGGKLNEECAGFGDFWLPVIRRER